MQTTTTVSKAGTTWETAEAAHEEMKAAIDMEEQGLGDVILSYSEAGKVTYSIELSEDGAELTNVRTWDADAHAEYIANNAALITEYREALREAGWTITTDEVI
jgi:hypothetical protein